MRNDDEELSVWVRRQWNDAWRGRYRLGALQGVHWNPTSVDTQEASPLPGLHGYVWCHEMLEGKLSRGARHGPCPHSEKRVLCPYHGTHGAYSSPEAREACPYRIEVCIIKRDNDPEVFRLLADKAGPTPRR